MPVYCACCGSWTEALRWYLHIRLSEDYQAALGYDMSDEEVAYDLGWIPACQECFLEQAQYISPEDPGLYPACEENIEWWQRPYIPSQ